MFAKIVDRAVHLIGDGDQFKYVARMMAFAVIGVIALGGMITNSYAQSIGPATVRASLEDSIVFEATRIASDRADAAHYGFWFARCGDRPKGYSESTCSQDAVKAAPDFLAIELRVMRDSVTIYSDKSPSGGDQVVRWVNAQTTPTVSSARLVIVCTTDGRIGWRDVHPASRSADARGVCWNFYEAATVANAEVEPIPMPKNP